MSFLIEKTDDSVILGDSLDAYLVLFAVPCEEPSHLGEARGVQQTPREQSGICAAGNTDCVDLCASGEAGKEEDAGN